MARRLGRDHLAQSFMAVDRPDFADATKRLSRTLRHNDRSDSTLFAAQVKQKIACLNVAGLCDKRKRNWYDVDLEDAVNSSDKLETSADEMRRFLRTASWAQIAVNLQKLSLKRRDRQSSIL